MVHFPAENTQSAAATAVVSGPAEFTPWFFAFSEDDCDWVVWGAVSEPDATGMTYQPSICTLSDSCGEEEARLIAAAPDLLEALLAAEDKHKRGLFDMTDDEVQRVHDLRRAAIAKATTAPSMGNGDE